MEVSALLPILSAVIPLIVEWIKHNPKIQSITPETKGRLMALAALLSTTGGVVAGSVDGTIDGNSLQMFIDAVSQSAVAFGLTQGFYNIFKWGGVFSKE